jgi:hypothetical protein
MTKPCLAFKTQRNGDGEEPRLPSQSNETGPDTYLVAQTSGLVGTRWTGGPVDDVQLTVLPASDPEKETKNIGLLLLLEFFDVLVGTHGGVGSLVGCRRRIVMGNYCWGRTQASRGRVVRVSPSPVGLRPHLCRWIE